MRIVTFGCSHTAGQGLADVYPATMGISKRGWPSKLAELNNCDILNLGFGGGSNLRIFLAYSYYAKNLRKDRDIVLILWTYPHRWTFFNTDKNVWIDALPPDNLSNIHPSRQAEHRYYYKRLYTSENQEERLLDLVSAVNSIQSIWKTPLAHMAVKQDTYNLFQQKKMKNTNSWINYNPIGYWYDSIGNFNLNMPIRGLDNLHLSEERQHYFAEQIQQQWLWTVKQELGWQ